MELTRAFMIRNDGKVFPVVIHPYGSDESIEETLFAAEWLFNHTNHQEVKDTVIKFVATWADQYCSMPFERVDAAKIQIKSKQYKFLSLDFVIKNGDHIEESETGDLLSLNKIVSEELNQEFLRVRFGGNFINVGSNEVVFRVSSTGFNWYNIIYDFVYKNQNAIETVTIVKDFESTGSDEAYHHGSESLDRMPVDIFLAMSGNPVIEKYDLTAEGNLLQNGCSLRCACTEKSLVSWIESLVKNRADESATFDC